MKGIIERRSDARVHPKVPEKVPVVTLNEHLQRVEAWTLKAHPTPPPNYKPTSMPTEQSDNHDLEAQSFLIVEGVRLLDTRDQQIASSPPTAVDDDDDDQMVDTIDSVQEIQDSELLEGRIGKYFRESKLSAKKYVKEFEHKVKQKKAFQSAIFNAYPYLKAKKDLKIPGGPLSSTHAIPSNTTAADDTTKALTEARSGDLWRNKQRNVRFSVKYRGELGIPQQGIVPGGTGGAQKTESEHSDLPDDTWTVNKHENDRDWWKWKLKQRVMENDELLQKLVDQRQKIASTFLQPGLSKIKTRRESQKSVVAPSYPSVVPSIPAFNRDASRHVTVEFQSNNPKSKASIAAAASTAKKGTIREPIPHFYSSKQFMDTVAGVSSDTPPESVPPPKLKPLKKDPYLAKLLAGNEMFKPEIMLDVGPSSSKDFDESQQRHHRPKQTGEQGRKVKQKISLESISDSEDEIAAQFFHPDVKVLYERLSEIDETTKSKAPVAALFSREPSDGFLNLPVLLATGRFSHYNKLPSMKTIITDKNSKKVTTKSEKSKSSKLDRNITNKMKKDNFIVSKMGNAVPSSSSGGSPRPGQEQVKVILGRSNKAIINKGEHMTTQEWAKRLMQRMKQPQSTGNKTEDDLTMSDSDDDVHTATNNDDPLQYGVQKGTVRGHANLDSVQTTKKYQVPIDQETNILYHEILMSKWKRDKHENRDRDTAPPISVPTAPVKKVVHDQGKKKTAAGAAHHHHHHHRHGSHHSNAINNKKETDKEKKNTEKVVPSSTNNNARMRPKGLDIWLENIRERAKRDRLISPLPGADRNPPDPIPTVGVKGKVPSFVTAFENAAFKISNHAN